MTPIFDQSFLALCLWREARGEGVGGMLAVACVIRNRVLRDAESYYTEVVKKWQFSSLTAVGDPELIVYPSEDPKNPNYQMWNQAQQIAASVIAGQQTDITHGATLYHTVQMGFPHTWDRSKVTQVAQIGNHIFYTEK